MVSHCALAGSPTCSKWRNPFTRSPLGAAQACGSGGDKGTRGQGVEKAFEVLEAGDIRSIRHLLPRQPKAPSALFHAQCPMPNAQCPIPNSQLISIFCKVVSLTTANNSRNS